MNSMSSSNNPYNSNNSNAPVPPKLPGTWWLAAFIVLFVAVNAIGYLAFFYGKLAVDVFRDAFLVVYPTFLIFLLGSFFVYYASVTAAISHATAKHDVAKQQAGKGGIVVNTISSVTDWPGYMKTAIIMVLFFVLSSVAMYMAFYNCETCPTHQVYTIGFVLCYVIFILAMFITFWLFHAKTIKDHVELTTKAVEMTTINAATARTAARTTTTTTGQSQGAGKEVTIELTKLREFKRNQLEKEVEQGQRQLEELQTEEKKSVLRDNGWSDEVLLQRALINLHDKLQIIRYVEMPLPTGFDDVIEKLDTMNFGEDKNGFTTVTIHDSDKIDPLLSKPELTQLVTALKPAYDQASVLRDQQVLREREQERDWYQ